MTFTEDELVFTFTNSTVDTVIATPWEINIDNLYLGQQLVTTGLGNVFINSIYSQYIFGDMTPTDGNLHLYEKIE